MLTFYDIKDIECFFQVINACVGGIFFQTNQDQYVDIRNNSLIKRLLEISCSQNGVERLDLYVECTDDKTKLLQYMIAGHREAPMCCL